MFTKRILFGLLLLLLFAPAVGAGDDELVCRIFTEETRFTLPESWIPGSLQVSPGNQTAAFVKKVGDKKAVVVNSETMPAYEDIIGDRIYFSPDGSRMAYIVKQSNQYQVVSNHREGQPYQAISPESLVFSLYGGNYAYIAQTNGQWCVVFNDREEKKYDSITPNSLNISDDGQQLVYAAQLGEKWYIIQNKQESKAYDGVRRVILSPNGKHWAAIVRQQDKLNVEFDGVSGAPYQMIKASSLRFTADGNHLSYVVEQEGKQFAVIDGKEERAYQAIGSAGVEFSPDGKETAYSAKQGDKWLVVNNGKPGSKFDGIMEGTPFFSPDGTKLVYAAQSGTEWFVVVNGVEARHYQAIGTGTICFSPNSKRLAYAAKTGDKWQVVLDGKTGRFYDEIGRNSLRFNYDSDNLVFSAQRGSEWFVVLDGTEGRTFESVVNGGNGQIYFDDPAYFNYYTVNQGQLFWIEERVPGKESFRDFRNLKVLEFTFNPPDGTNFVATTKITDSIKSDFGLADNTLTELKERVEIKRTVTGYRLDWQIISFNSTAVDSSTKARLKEAFVGAKYSYELDSQGKMVKITGIKELTARLQTKLNRQLYQEFASELTEDQIREAWKYDVEIFIGESFRIGNFWEGTDSTQVSFGVSAKMYFLIRFAKAMNQRVAFVNIRKFDSIAAHDLISPELLQEIKLKVPGAVLDATAEVKGEGEIIIDPDTMLSYGTRDYFTVKLGLVAPKLGRKNLTIERQTETSYEYGPPAQ